FRVPALSLVTKVGACSKQIFDRRQISHSIFSFSVVTTRTAIKPQSEVNINCTAPPKRLLQAGDCLCPGDIAWTSAKIEKKDERRKTRDERICLKTMKIVGSKKEMQEKGRFRG
ncbi:hypothetical protein, partial [uncultured Fibrobacter sp.]|uniref:hypothetical protein n=1 Tax=uncultured Fibrobacter sp. TaxID=261512 RepID=UPI0025F4B52B